MDPKGGYLCKKKEVSRICYYVILHCAKPLSVYKECDIGNLLTYIFSAAHNTRMGVKFVLYFRGPLRIHQDRKHMGGYDTVRDDPL